MRLDKQFNIRVSSDVLNKLDALKRLKRANNEVFSIGQIVRDAINKTIN